MAEQKNPGIKLSSPCYIRVGNEADKAVIEKTLGDQCKCEAANPESNSDNPESNPNDED